MAWSTRFFVSDNLIENIITNSDHGYVLYILVQMFRRAKLQCESSAQQ